ncbi:hypothetical protein FRC08_018183 [Ceratobasidium sp. 394]|nr:hypothetical protein FRC08_018183 [Ceratobasidium sp. 394]KAG9093536.1 hypothetical protein FS749_014223 [Ceratobasidium sp. UAMH 11750]
MAFHGRSSSSHDHLHHIVGLLRATGNNEHAALSAQDCTELAQYLILIHDNYQAFHNGSASADPATVSPLVRAPIVGHDLLALRRGGRRTGRFRLTFPTRYMFCDALNCIFALLRDLERATGGPVLMNGGSASQFHSAFISHRMPYLPLPIDLQDWGTAAFGRTLPSLATAQMLLNDTQLWVAFTPLFCGLLARALQLDIPSCPPFTAYTFGLSPIAVQAHNWYMELNNAPVDLYWSDT